jgi:hypothetical protein
MAVGPLGDLGALGVMHAPSHAKAAKDGRVNVASHLACDVHMSALTCDVGESGTMSIPNVGDKLRRYSGKVKSPRPSWRSWRAWRDAVTGNKKRRDPKAPSH